eukprot:GEMP01043782.1.p1 GENE.GEMP01043782.1~~GEMP01043782.1.p1  ORF type:complete len:188 (+),score=44.86 GEMP01043782.1:55-618(+)
MQSQFVGVIWTPCIAIPIAYCCSAEKMDDDRREIVSVDEPGDAEKELQEPPFSNRACYDEKIIGSDKSIPEEINKLDKKNPPHRLVTEKDKIELNRELLDKSGSAFDEMVELRKRWKLNRMWTKSDDQRWDMIYPFIRKYEVNNRLLLRVLDDADERIPPAEDDYENLQTDTAFTGDKLDRIKPSFV